MSRIIASYEYTAARAHLCSIITAQPYTRDEPILLLFSPIFLSGNSFIFSLLCSIFCSKLNILLKV